MIKKVCDFELCNNEFETENKNQKYCHRNCLRKAEYRRNNKRYKEYEKKNREKLNNYYVDYYHKNKDRISELRKKRYNKNPTNTIERVNKYRLENLDKIKQSKKKWGIKNKPIRNEKHRQRYKDDELYRLRYVVRNRMRNFLRDKGWGKECATSKILGCTYKELKTHLEKQFKDNMSWDSKINIDHVIPLASANNKEELFKLCHYTNLQPLLEIDNLKKSNKITFKEIVF